MHNIPATRFKAQCLELMNRVAEQRVSYVITKRGRPVAKLVPIERRPKDSIFGWLRATGSVRGNIVNPVVSPEDWRGLEQWDEMQGSTVPQRSRRVTNEKRKWRRR